MKYTLYPGCSLEKNASAYMDSMLAVAKPLGIEFTEIDDWNCCGATEYISLNLMAAYSLIARNLALAAKQNGTQTLVAPCSACYLNLSKVDKYMGETPRLAENVNSALAAGGLAYKAGTVKTRHLLDVVVNDIGYDAVKAQIKKPLTGLRIAPYYGCLIVRPGYGGKFDDFEQPTTLDRLLKALGAEVVDFPLKAQCCGGHMTQISEATGYELIRRLVKGAADYKADLMVTLCPMCQLNVDAFQGAMNRYFKTDFHMPILFFTQVMGLAFGIEPEKLGFGKEFVEAESVVSARLGIPMPKARPVPVPSGEAPKAEAPKSKAKRPKEALPMPKMPGEEVSE
jgi:heterodisulfide reductase subunit B